MIGWRDRIGSRNWAAALPPSRELHACRAGGAGVNLPGKEWPGQSTRTLKGAPPYWVGKGTQPPERSSDGQSAEREAKSDHRLPLIC